MRYASDNVSSHDYATNGLWKRAPASTLLNRRETARGVPPAPDFCPKGCDERQWYSEIVG